MTPKTYAFMTEQQAIARREDLLRFLRNRKIFVDSDSRDRITACSDSETMDRWMDRSVTITEIAELFQD